MICFFVKTKATDDTRSIPPPFTLLSLSLFPRSGPFLFFSFFFFLSFFFPQEREPRARKADGAFTAAAFGFARAKRVGGKLFAVALPAAESGRGGSGGLKANRRRFRFNDRYGTV